MAFHFPASFEGITADRQEPCRFCGAGTGMKIAETEYWNLKHSSVIKCPVCGLIQLDPMLSDEETAAGCNAYHFRELEEIAPGEQARNLVRNYRRGILFGFQLKRKGFTPGEILEFGPGSGYFSAGVRFVFPASRITVVDIVDDVLEKNRNIHHFDTIRGNPASSEIQGTSSFDLVIARDILEHVTDIGSVIRNAARLLRNGGLFHFLTPNGHEDVWGHYLNWTFTGKPSELLINHVNYFDGKGLRDFLERQGFSPVTYYSFQVKTTLRGKGWSMKKKLAANIAAGKAVKDHHMKEKKGDDPPLLNKDEILDAWYLNTRHRWLTHLVCLYHHAPRIRLHPSRNIGHEFYGLFSLTKKTP